MTSISFVATKHVFCRFFLSRQIFVVINIILSRQGYFCRDKRVFVATKHVFCCDNIMLLATKVLSHQTRVCRDNQINVCGDKPFVAASILSSRQKTGFVATKMILVAAAASDIFRL